MVGALAAGIVTRGERPFHWKELNVRSASCYELSRLTIGVPVGGWRRNRGIAL